MMVMLLAACPGGLGGLAGGRIWLAGQKQQGLVVNCRGQVVDP